MNRNTNPASLLSMPRVELDALSDLNPVQRQLALNLLRRYYASIHHPDRTGRGDNRLSDVNRAIDALITSFGKYKEVQPADGAIEGQLQRLREDNSYLRDRLVQERGEAEKLKLQIAGLQSRPKRIEENLDYKKLWQKANKRHRELFWEMRHEVGKWRSKSNEETRHLTGIIIGILCLRAPPKGRYAGARFVMKGSKTSLQVETDGQVTYHTLGIPIQKRGQLLGFISAPQKLRGNTYLPLSNRSIDVLEILTSGVKKKFLVDDSMVTFDNSKISKIRISGGIKRVEW